MQSKLRPNVLVLMIAAACVALAGIGVLWAIGGEGENVGAIVGVVGTFLAMAGATAKELVSPEPREKSDLELVLEHLGPTVVIDETEPPPSAT